MQDKKSYINSAIKTIKTEIEGLNSLLEFLGEEYSSAVDLILNCKGKVVVSGMGESGHIARKIAATFASTGTPSFFVHPGEAGHGDLGMIGDQDVAILLSNSGETKELRDIIYYCKRFGIPIICMVRKSGSELAKASNVPLILPEVPEANSVNAPTTSTTMMLVLGDALSVSLIDARGFSLENFGTFHPGGKLGSAFLKVGELMRSGEHVPLVSRSQSIYDILMEMTSKNLGCTGVVDENGKVIGIITDGDLRRNITSDFTQFKAEDLMTKNPILTKSEILAVEAIVIMNKKSITSLLVINENNIPVGVLHLHDCLRAGVR